MKVKFWTVYINFVIIYSSDASICIDLQLTIKIKVGSMVINPLTPVTSVTGRNKSWPLFHYWRHHLWPILASSVLKFFRRKRSFQWYSDQSDRWVEPEICLKMLRNLSEKLRAKLPATTWGYSMVHVKFTRLNYAFSELIFWTGNKHSRRTITAAKR